MLLNQQIIIIRNKGIAHTPSFLGKKENCNARVSNWLGWLGAKIAELKLDWNVRNDSSFS
jgi:hypothetical protein